MEDTQVITAADVSTVESVLGDVVNSPVVPEVIPQEVEPVAVPAETYDEAQKAAAVRIKALAGRVSKLVAINGPAALDSIEGFISSMEG